MEKWKRNKELEGHLAFRCSSYLNIATEKSDFEEDEFLSFWTNTLKDVLKIDSRTIVNSYENESLIWRDSVKEEIMRIKVTEGW
jgi:hypothetical protein